MSTTTSPPEPSLSFDRFFYTVREDELPIISPAKFARAFHMQIQEVAIEARVHRNTLRRHPESPQAQQFLRDSLKVLSAVSEIQSDVRKGMYWMRNHPIPSFAHKTAMELIGTGRADDVVTYLESIADGFSG